MELPQPRPFGTQGRKPTHEFLSLYSPSQQDPTPTPPGGYLKTHDFLQPLAKEGKKVEVAAAPTTMVEHNLPGGIGTYTISHISYINQSQRLPKPEGVATMAAQSSSSDKNNDDNSNCSSYTGSGFNLWEESAAKKGKTGKENITGNRHVIREGAMKIGGVPWPSQSSSSHPSAQKNQSFVDMLKSAKFAQEDEDDDEEEELVIKKEPSSSSYHKGIMSVKVDTGNPDQKPNTPRSKHSATEQRRRSKINDRFSMLRELIPHGDQKRDKASFLLEVIEYIQFLQEKVHTYEDSHRGWNNELPWNSQRPTTDHSLLPNGVSLPPSLFASKLDEHNNAVAPNTLRNGQNLLDSDTSSLEATNQHPQLTNNTSNMASQPWQSRSCTADKLSDHELTIESGTISISTIYSQGLLSTLTQALQSSGVDLSHANISVQIDLGKRANSNTLNPSAPIIKKTEVPSVDQSLARSRPASVWGEESDKAFKRLKTSGN